MTSVTEASDSTLNHAEKHTEKQPTEQPIVQNEVREEPQDSQEQPKPAARKPRQPYPGNKKKKNRSGPLDKVVARFAACDRCSYFLAGYRSIFGLEQLETAVAEIKNNCLTLEWSLDMRNLVHKTYGVRVDLDYYYYEGCCSHCQRQYVYWRETPGPDEEAETAPEALEAFRICL